MVDRKELRREYKETRRPMGVYRILNKENGKSFVASSTDLTAIFNRIRMQLNTGDHRQCPQLQQDWKRLGADVFDFEILEELQPPDSPDWDASDDLKALEEMWLKELSPFGERGYNR